MFPLMKINLMCFLKILHNRFYILVCYLRYFWFLAHCDSLVLPTHHRILHTIKNALTNIENAIFSRVPLISRQSNPQVKTSKQYDNALLLFWLPIKLLIIFRTTCPFRNSVSVVLRQFCQLSKFEICRQCSTAALSHYGPIQPQANINWFHFQRLLS